MTASRRSTLTRASCTTMAGRLFVLDLSGGRVFSMNPDGSDSKTLVTGCRLPDGIAVDVEAGHLYWSDMGVANRNDGKIERADLGGGNRRTIVPASMIIAKLNNDFAIPPYAVAVILRCRSISNARLC